MHTNAMGRKKANDSILARRFFEAKAFLDSDSEALLVEHLAMCNRLTRTLFNRSIAQKIPATDISSREASLALAPELAALNVDQANLVSRAVVAKRKRAVGLAKHRVEDATRIVKSHRLKIEALERVLMGLQGLQGPQAPAESDAIYARRAAGAAQIAAKIARRRQAMREQTQTQRQAQHEVDSGLAPVCFGSSKLAAQRHDVGAKGSAFKSAKDWKEAWDIARNGSYFFEGNSVAAGRNRSVKAEVGAGGAVSLRVRLSEQRAELLMVGWAKDAGIAMEEFMTGADHSPARMACRFLKVDLSAKGKRQLELLDALATALTQEGDAATTVAWTISWAWEPKPDGAMARRFKFRASWAQPVEEATDAANGAVGFQVSDGSLRWAWVDRSGNPAKGRKTANGSELPWHGSMPVGAADMRQGRRLQLEREAAIALARIAAQRQCPCAVEEVSIPLRRLELGLKHSTAPKPVNLEVRRELSQAIELAAARFGVRTIGVGAILCGRGWLRQIRGLRGAFSRIGVGSHRRPRGSAVEVHKNHEKHRRRNDQQTMGWPPGLGSGSESYASQPIQDAQEQSPAEHGWQLLE